MDSRLDGLGSKSGNILGHHKICIQMRDDIHHRDQSGVEALVNQSEVVATRLQREVGAHKHGQHNVVLSLVSLD